MELVDCYMNDFPLKSQSISRVLFTFYLEVNATVVYTITLLSTGMSGFLLACQLPLATLEMMNYTFQTSDDENMKGDIWVNGMNHGFFTLGKRFSKAIEGVLRNLKSDVTRAIPLPCLFYACFLPFGQFGHHASCHSPPSPGTYFMRAKKAWFLAKKEGLVFNGSNEDTIRGLEEDLRENWPVCC